MRRLLLLLPFLFSLLFLPAVQAHTELVSATPAPDSTLSEFPSEVFLTFNEKLLLVGEENPNKVEIFDESGALLSGASLVDGEKISTSSGITGNGKFTVKYHVAAQDGHVVKGEYSFTVQSDIAVASPIGNSDTDQGEDAGPNLLVRLVGTAILGGLALILLRRARI